MRVFATCFTLSCLVIADAQTVAQACTSGRSSSARNQKSQLSSRVTNSHSTFPHTITKISSVWSPKVKDFPLAYHPSSRPLYNSMHGRAAFHAAPIFRLDRPGASPRSLSSVVVLNVLKGTIKSPTLQEIE